MFLAAHPHRFVSTPLAALPSFLPRPPSSCSSLYSKPGIFEEPEADSPAQLLGMLTSQVPEKGVPPGLSSRPLQITSPHVTRLRPLQHGRIKVKNTCLAGVFLSHVVVCVSAFNAFQSAHLRAASAQEVSQTCVLLRSMLYFLVHL